MSEPEDHPIWSARPVSSPPAALTQPFPPAAPVADPLSEATAALSLVPPPAAVSPVWSPVLPTSGAPISSPSGGAPRRRTGLIVLAGIIVLAVVAGAVTVVALVGHGKKPSSTTAANQPAANVPAADQASGGVGQPIDPGQANAAVSNAATPPSAAPSMQSATLVDNFTGTAPDTHRWGLYESTAANGAKWLKTNIQVHNGELQVIGAGNDPTGKTDTSGGLCWCGEGGNRLYGTWEVRARYDAGSGYGQVIGLWPHSDTQADGSLSFADTSDPARQNMHGRVVAKAAPGTVQTTVKGDFTAWHTFKVDWRATFIKMYVDDKIFFDSTTSSTRVTIPATPMHLIMQQPVGPSGSVPAANASTPGKVIMHIDWVKVSP